MSSEIEKLQEIVLRNDPSFIQQAELLAESLDLLPQLQPLIDIVNGINDFENLPWSGNFSVMEQDEGNVFTVVNTRHLQLACVFEVSVSIEDDELVLYCNVVHNKYFNVYSVIPREYLKRNKQYEAEIMDDGPLSLQDSFVSKKVYLPINFFIPLTIFNNTKQLTSLIEKHFKTIDKSFKDYGDKLFQDPEAIKQLKKNFWGDKEVLEDVLSFYGW
jgi:hypothetical protein